MCNVAEFTIPLEALPGGATLAERPDATFAFERHVPTGEPALPNLRVYDDDPTAVADRLRAEPSVATVDLLAAEDGTASFEWVSDAPVVDHLTSADVTVLAATGTAEGWAVRVRTRDRERLAEFQGTFTDRGDPVEVRRVRDFAELLERDRPLTAQQRETLVRAYREGYFDRPRGTTQSELGDSFEISGRAVSERLRRGTKNLVANVLLDPGADPGLADNRL